MKKREKTSVPAKPTFAIIVDGESEFWYFQMLKRNERTLNINIKPEIPQKKSLKEQFEMVKEFSDFYDKVFWILDLDVIIKESKERSYGVETPLDKLKNYISEIEKEQKYVNVFVIINTPCFEYWFLLHYKQTTKYFNTCCSVINLLKKLVPDYSKTKEFFTKQNNDIYIRLKPQLSKAIQNAKLTGKFDADNPQKGLSEMYKFFQTMEIKLNL